RRHARPRVGRRADGDTHLRRERASGRRADVARRASVELRRRRWELDARVRRARRRAHREAVQRRRAPLRQAHVEGAQDDRARRRRHPEGPDLRADDERLRPVDDQEAAQVRDGVAHDGRVEEVHGVDAPFRAIFFGTPALSVPSLEALASIANVVGVVCQPDKPVGRGMKLAAPPVKERALAMGLPVVQPTKLRTGEFAQWVREQNADVALVIAYGRILPQDVLDAPRLGCVNVHASILPKYRGAAPIAWAIVRGETETGVTLMKMDAGMDTGDMLEIRKTPIGQDETAGELGVRLGELGATAVREGLPRYVRGELPA